MNIRDILHFDTMITPKIITVVYWLMLLFAVVSGLGMMFGGYRITFFGFLTGLAAMIGGAVAARIWCELFLVLFKIHENLQKTAAATELKEPV
ncbi:DUF4282 domain-containing protein [Pokkaliibacter sp. MBI-7]|uniref:DUF4282 domain-containing protein n=1 Tax=Pokkaliibacter sp. MBI-7 TaxID=3040600 RepID=UPI00244784DE|nr:DUF4282 domain-containing protein [Pokkaliibacter sp. MBI-7]MDH2431055.1 DUF4282 domain-containing protein [Pokkaliibacter sp. MBI-7]MDH2436750.1 DUF4282 domain-containing protein [Pokkaliibacter sp. MBI-7]